MCAWLGKECVGDWSGARVSAADGFDFTLCRTTLLCGQTCSCALLLLPRTFLRCLFLLSSCLHSQFLSLFFFFHCTFHTLSAAPNPAAFWHEPHPLSSPCQTLREPLADTRVPTVCFQCVSINLNRTGSNQTGKHFFIVYIYLYFSLQSAANFKE